MNYGYIYIKIIEKGGYGSVSSAAELALRADLFAGVLDRHRQRLRGDHRQDDLTLRGTRHLIQEAISYYTLKIA